MIKKDDSSAPATKQDIQMILQEIRESRGESKQEAQTLQDQINLLSKYMGSLVTKEELKERIEGVLVSQEKIRLEIQGFQNDRFTEHDKQIRAIKTHVGMAA